MWFQTWSLAVEEHFYLLLAGAVYLLFRIRRGLRPRPAGPFSAIPAIVGILAVVCLLARIITYLCLSRFEPDLLLYPSHLRMDSMAFGVLLSYWWHLNPGERFRAAVAGWRLPLVALGMVLFMPAFVWDVDTHPWLSIWGVILLYVGAGMLVLGLLLCPELETSRVLNVIGRMGSYSYSVYLWHGIYIALGVAALRGLCRDKWGNAAEFITCFVGSWVLGIFAAKLIELPVLKLRERYSPSRVPKPRASLTTTIPNYAGGEHDQKLVA
jgi:peptidoglycan/LPS O-acetylase OafA/YrhL